MSGPNKEPLIADPQKKRKAKVWGIIQKKMAQEKSQLDTGKVFRRDEEYVPPKNSPDFPSGDGREPVFPIDFSAPVPCQADPDCEDELDSLEEDALTLLRGLKAGTVNCKDLPRAQRILVVQMLREQGRNQDEIAALLGVSRRTITSDVKAIKQMEARSTSKIDKNQIAGEVINSCDTWIQKCVQEGFYKSAAHILRQKVEMLQGMGFLPRVPRKQAILSAHTNVASQTGFQNYQDALGPHKDKAIALLEQVFSQLSQGAKGDNGHG